MMRKIRYHTLSWCDISAFASSSCTPLRQRGVPRGGVGRGQDDHLQPSVPVAFTSCYSSDKWLKVRTNVDYYIFHIRRGVLSHAVATEGCMGFRVGTSN